MNESLSSTEKIYRIVDQELINLVDDDLELFSPFVYGNFLGAADYKK